MLSADYSYSSRQARDLLAALGKNVDEGLEELLHKWIEHYRTVSQPAIFEAHEGQARTGQAKGTHPAWAALSPAYLDSRAKRESLHAEDVMQLTGALREDLTTGTEHTRLVTRRTSDGMEVEFGTGRDYPVWAGGGVGGPRQVMYITASDVQALEDITNRFIGDLLVEAREKAGRGEGLRLTRELQRALRTTARGAGRL